MHAGEGKIRYDRNNPSAPNRGTKQHIYLTKTFINVHLKTEDPLNKKRQILLEVVEKPTLPKTWAVEKGPTFEI